MVNSFDLITYDYYSYLSKTEEDYFIRLDKKKTKYQNLILNLNS